MLRSFSIPPCCLLILVSGCPDVSDILVTATADKGSSSSGEGTTPATPTTDASSTGSTTNSTTSATSTTTISTTTPDETSTSTGSSSTGTQEAVCGNGKMEGDECDDRACAADTRHPMYPCTPEGLKTSSCYYDLAECSPAGCSGESCIPASCGDGQVNSPSMVMEECDNGEYNLSSMEASQGDCIEDSCVRAKCGDGILNNGEECDDGPDANRAPHDGCYECKNEYIAFVTSQTFFVNSVDPNLTFNSVSSANTRCQKAAESAALAGTYRAWLSDDSTSPKSGNWLPAEQPILGREGEVIVSNSEDLLNGSAMFKLTSPIIHNEYSEKLPGAPTAWTGTSVTGDKSNTCGNWKMTDFIGTKGSPALTTYGWKDAGTAECNVDHHLYCIREKN